VKQKVKDGDGNIQTCQCHILTTDSPGMIFEQINTVYT